MAIVAGIALRLLQKRRHSCEAPAVRRAEVLSFVAMDDGSARVRVDVTLPVAQGAPLLRLLLDAGLMLGEALP